MKPKCPKCKSNKKMVYKEEGFLDSVDLREKMRGWVCENCWIYYLTSVIVKKEDKNV